MPTLPWICLATAEAAPMRFLNAQIMGPAPGWRVPDLLTSVEEVAERLEQCARIPPLLVGQEACPQVAKHRSKGKRRGTRALQKHHPSSRQTSYPAPLAGPR